MANCRKSASSADFNAVVRRSNVAAIKAANGLTCTFAVVNDLEIVKADGTTNGKTYCGLVPVINGVERRDLALTQYDLLAENIPTFPAGDDVVFITPQDRLHTAARNAWTDGITMQAWLNAIVAAVCPGGAACTLQSIDYAARNKNGGTFQASILGVQ